MNNSSKVAGKSITFSIANSLAVISTSALNLTIPIRFGAGHQADAFFLAYTVPSVLTGIMTASVRFVLVPAIVRVVEEHSPTVSSRILYIICLFGFMLWSAISLVGILGGATYIEILAPSIAPHEQKLAARITRWIFVIIPLTWLAEFLRAFLNSERQFILPVVGEGFASILAIGLILGFSEYVGIIVVGYSFIAKIITQIIVSGFGFRSRIGDLPTRGTKSVSYCQEVKKVFQGLGIRWGASLLRQSSVMIERFWATSTGVGLISALSYSQTGANALSKIFSASVATTLLPFLSQSAWRQSIEIKGNQDETASALRLALFITIPVSIFSSILSLPAFQAIFAFNETSFELVKTTAILFSIYTFRTSTLALVSLLLAPFYALEDIRTPVKHMIIMLGINLALDAALFSSLGIYAFPVAAVLTDLLSIARAFWLQEKIGIRYPAGNIGHDLVIILASASMTALILLPIRHYGVSLFPSERIEHLIVLSLGVLVSSIAYLVVTSLAGIPEAKRIAWVIKQRIQGDKC